MKTRLGFIGLGPRGGKGLLPMLYNMDDVEIKIICDKKQSKLDDAIELLKTEGKPLPDTTTTDDEVFSRKDIDAVIIATSWNDHIPLAIKGMEAGLYVGFEVGPVATIEQCFDLVNTFEKTGRQCMIMENCCWGKNELTVLNMIKKGLFGEVVHVEGGYQHDIRIASQQYANGKERIDHYLKRNFDSYPTHELGPMLHYLDINRGNRLLTLTSTASKSRGFKKYVQENFDTDSALYSRDFNCGDVITTVIKCANGETMTLTLNTSLPHPYSRLGRVEGTNGVWFEDVGIYVEGRSEDEKWDSFDSYMDEYEHPLWKAFERIGVTGEHGGMDYLMLRAFVDAVKNKKPLPIDIYDSATMLAVSVLSEQSIALGSAPVYIPDFTKGRWVNRRDESPSIFSVTEVDDSLYENIHEI